MTHLLILSFLPLLIIGTVAASMAWQIHRARAAGCARSLFYYLLCLNLLAFVYLVARYAFSNVLESGAQDARILAHTGITIGAFIALAGSTYWLLRTAVDLRSRQLPRAALRLIHAAIALCGASYLMGLGVLARTGSQAWLRTSNTTVVIVMTLSSVAISAVMALVRVDVDDPARRGAVRRLGIAFLAGYSIFIAALVTPRPWNLPVSASALLWLNCAALHWLRSRAPLFCPAATITDIASALDRLVAKYTLTPREREVMELLFQGKSYKEIEDLLCISLGTVKNHAYNLYRKTGVSSRGQLIHLAIGGQSSTTE